MKEPKIKKPFQRKRSAGKGLSAYLTGRSVEFFLSKEDYDLLKLKVLVTHRTTRSILVEVITKAFKKGPDRKQLVGAAIGMVKKSWLENQGRFQSRGAELSLTEFKKSVEKDLQNKGISQDVIDEIIGGFTE